MTELTLEELEEKFDEIFERVDEGEKFLIRSDIGDAVLVPYYDYESNQFLFVGE